MDLSKKSRRELQNLAKEHGIKANLKTTELLSQLSRVFDSGQNAQSVSSSSESLTKSSDAENDSTEINKLTERVAKVDLGGEETVPSKQENVAKKQYESPKKQYESPLSSLMRRVSNASQNSSEKSRLRTPSSAESFRTPQKNGSATTTSASRTGDTSKRVSENSSIWTPKLPSEDTPSRRYSSEGRRLSAGSKAHMSERIRILVNALRVLRPGRKGCTMNQICEFIEKNPTRYYDAGRTSVQLSRALRAAGGQGLVENRKESSGEIRFFLSNGKQKPNESPPPPPPLSSPIQLSPASTAPTSSPLENRRMVKPVDAEVSRRIREAVKRERIRRNHHREQFKQTMLEGKLRHTIQKIDSLTDTLIPSYTCGLCQKKCAESSEVGISQSLNDLNAMESRLVIEQPVDSPERDLPVDCGRNRYRAPSAAESFRARKAIPQTPGFDERPPQKLPERTTDWTKRESRSKPGRFYYYNVVTRETTWALPEHVLADIN
mmetsp:Transcript_15128/g.32336  ORF Transcript_15128/g.32336 Transcript_15128/m.32336 type:complete len:492 (-) Transcript_15128:5758-7233(-)